MRKSTRRDPARVMRKLMGQSSAKRKTTKPISEGQYVDYDHELSTWVVLGEDTGKCYGHYETENIAIDALPGRTD